MQAVPRTPSTGHGALALRWAMTHHNLANALVAIAEQEGRRRRLEDAVRHYDQAIEAYEAQGAFAFAALARPARDQARALLAQDRPG